MTTQKTLYQILNQLTQDDNYMEQNKQDIIFVDGYETKDIPDTTPDYILGKGSFNVDKMIEFLTKYKALSVSGYLNFETKRSKSTGKRYTQLDLYRFNQQPDQVKEDALINLRNPGYPTPTSQGIDLSKTLSDTHGISPEDLDGTPWQGDLM